MTIETRDDLFVHELKGTDHMEARLVEDVDEMATHATNWKISGGFADHCGVTAEHARRIEAAFEALGESDEERDSPIVEVLDEKRRTVEEAVADEELLSFFSLGAGTKTERIEMTAYRGLLRMADRLDLDDEVTGPLESNLDDEEATFRELESLAGASDLKSLWEQLTP